MKQAAFIHVIPLCSFVAPNKQEYHHLLSDAALFAVHAVRDGAVICRNPSRVSVNKQDGTPVTSVDFAVQARVASLLQRELPADSLLSEEALHAFDQLDESAKNATAVLAGLSLQRIREVLAEPRYPVCNTRTPGPLDHGSQQFSAAEALQNQPRLWTLDPCDGTKGLISGDNYAIGLARLPTVMHSCPDVAALALPNHQLILVADAQTLYKFSFSGNHVICVCQPQSESSPDRSLRWHFSPASREIHIAGLPAPTPMCCGSLVKYAQVAIGASCALIQSLPECSAKLWDHCAGIAAVCAAGGTVTDLDGNRVYFQHNSRFELRVDAPGVVATGPGVEHDYFCRAARTALV